MKKLLLLAAAALTVVACKKDNGGDPTPPPAPGPTPQTQTPTVSVDQSSIPTAVDFAYPKSTVMTTNYGRTTTVTYTVNNKLLTEVNVEDSSSSNRRYKLHYDANNYLTSVEDMSSHTTLLYTYNGKGQLIGVSGEFAGSTYSRTLEYNAQGKLVKVIQREGDNQYPDHHDFTLDYSTPNQLIIKDKDLDPSYPEKTYTYQLNAKENIVSIQGSDIGTTSYTGYDDKVNIRSKSPFKYFDEYGNFRPYTTDITNSFIKSVNNPITESWVQGRDSHTINYTYEYNGSNVTKVTIVLQPSSGSSSSRVIKFNY